jgi:hypothetical protein
MRQNKERAMRPGKCGEAIVGQGYAKNTAAAGRACIAACAGNATKRQIIKKDFFGKSRVLWKHSGANAQAY